MQPIFLRIRTVLAGALLFVAALALPAGAAGPLPTAGTADVVGVIAGNTDATLDLLIPTHHANMYDASVAIAKVQKLEFPDAELVAIFGRMGSEGSEAVRLTFDSGSAVLSGAQIQLAEADAFGDFAITATQNKLGIAVNPFATPPAQAGAAPACLTDIQGALDVAAPGAELVICPGTYAPFVVRQHLVTVRAAQGPLATVVDAAGGDGIQVLAAGVTISGFQVRGATGPSSAAIVVGSARSTLEDRLTGDLVGTTLRGNLLRDSTHGIVVWKAAGTLIAANTIRSMEVGILIESEAGGEPAEDTLGTLIIANNFVANRGYAVENRSPQPAFAVHNYFGFPVGPNVELVDGCFGPSAPFGDPRCRNAVGTGVVNVGFSPLPI